MKKLLLLINYIPVCMIFMTCNSASQNIRLNQDDNISPDETIILTNADTNSIIKDTLPVGHMHVIKDDTLVIKRVEHSSNEQEKLDSIKNAKAKKKKNNKYSN